MSCADALDALGGADRLDERIALANDLAVLADAAGDAASAVVAAHERAMAATLAGDDETAQACLRVIEEAAAKTDDRVAAALVAEHEAAKAAMTGHFDDAVVAVEAAVLEASSMGRRRRRSWPGGTVRCWHGCWALGRLCPPTPVPPKGGMRPQTPHSSTSSRRCRPLRLVARDLAAGVRPLPTGDELPHALGVLALVAADLRDAALVDPVRALLAPHADMTCGIGYRTFAGVAAFHLGRLAAVTGDWADAERHMLAALRRFSAPGLARGWRSRSTCWPTWSRRGGGRPTVSGWPTCGASPAGRPPRWT